MFGGSKLIFTKEVDILFGEPQRDLRHTLRSVLSREGYENIRDINQVGEFQDVLEQELPDLLIMDASMGGGKSPTEMVREMRHGVFGKNPYIPIIFTIWEPTKQIVSAVAASGADDLLVKPLSPVAMLDRIKTLAMNRKNFVVASDYIGPDRRTKRHVDIGQEEIPTFKVPNTLKMKSLGQAVNVASLEAEINKTKGRINNLKLERNAFQMAFLVELIVPALRGAGAVAQLQQNLEALFIMAKDTSMRLNGSAYDHVADLCSSMITVTSALVDQGAGHAEKDVKLLKPLSEAILLACHPESDSITLAGKITGAINRFHTKE